MRMSATMLLLFQYWLDPSRSFRARCWKTLFNALPSSIPSSVVGDKSCSPWSSPSGSSGSSPQGSDLRLVRPPSISTRGGGSGASGLGQKGQSSGTHTLTGFHRASHLFGLTNYEIVASQHRSWLLIPLSTTSTILFQDNTAT